MNPSRAAIIAALCAVSLAFPACDRDAAPRVLVAEFLDETPDGVARPDETIRVVLDRPLEESASLDRIRVRSDPPADWVPRVGRSPGEPAVLLVRIVTGSPDFRFQGLHGRDPAATGLGIDLGDGVERWTDLQLADSLPVLERAVWQDRGDPSGNLVVDQGDSIRLVFDRPVRPNLTGADAARIRCPQDIILSKATDRLDDGDVRAFLAAGSKEREVLLILGSRPVLTVAGELPSTSGSVQRFASLAPSGIALNGTTILPMGKIVDRRGGRGAISLREVDIEYEEGFALPVPLGNGRFPAPGHRVHATLTPIVGGRAVVAGGATPGQRAALDQVVLFDPFHRRQNKESPSPFVLLASRLARPSFHHTATLLPGRDRILGTADDLILVAGGTDGTRAHAALTLLRVREDGDVEAAPLDASLEVARSEHAAVALRGNRVLIDGGRTTGTDAGTGIVGSAEVISLDVDADPVKVSSHVVFRSQARMRHTATLLAPGPEGETFVFLFGGYGDPRRRVPERDALGEPIVGPGAPDAIFPTDDGAVLVSPVLLDIDAPAASVWRLPFEFSLSLLRSGHVAVPITAGPYLSERADETLGADLVLVAGGTSRHLLHGFDGGRALWQMPVTPDIPSGNEASNAILFRFQAGDPGASTLEVLPHPAPDPTQATDRVYASAVEVPGKGVFILGGEQLRGLRDSEPLATVEVVLRDTERLAEAAVRLGSPRSRQQAYHVDLAGTRSIFVIGGAPSIGGAPEDFPAVEEIPLGK